MRINTWTLSLRLQSNLLHLPDVSCQDIKLIFLDFWQNKLFPFFYFWGAHRHILIIYGFFSYSPPMMENLKFKLWKFFFVQKTYNSLKSAKEYKKIISKCKISCIFIVENWTHVSHHFTAFFLIRARWKILSWIFLYALLISLWFSSFLLFVFPFFCLSLTFNEVIMQNLNSNFSLFSSSLHSSQMDMKTIGSIYYENFVSFFLIS